MVSVVSMFWHEGGNVVNVLSEGSCGLPRQICRSATRSAQRRPFPHSVQGDWRTVVKASMEGEVRGKVHGRGWPRRRRARDGDAAEHAREALGEPLASRCCLREVTASICRRGAIQWAMGWILVGHGVDTSQPSGGTLGGMGP